MEDISFSAKARATIRRYLKWYAVPFIYFLLTSLICAYAWYIRPVPYRAGIKVVFEKISLNPTLILTGVITVWTIIAIISIPIVVWLKKRFPEFSPGTKSEDFSFQEPSSNRKLISSWGKTLNIATYILGIILIFAGLCIFIWVQRPYINFLFRTSKIEELERKAERLGEIQRVHAGKGSRKQREGEKSKLSITEETVGAGPSEDEPRNLLIIPTGAVEESVLEGVNAESLAKGVGHVTASAWPGQGGNCIIEGHNVIFDWGEGPFSMLEVIKKGEPIYLFYRGKKYEYVTKKQFFTNADDPKLYDLSRGERLTIITCASGWDSPSIETKNRMVIVAYPKGSW